MSGRVWFCCCCWTVVVVVVAVNVLTRTVGRGGVALTIRGEDLADDASDGATDVVRDRLCCDAPDELDRSRPETGGDITTKGL